MKKIRFIRMYSIKMYLFEMFATAKNFFVKNIQKLFKIVLSKICYLKLNG